MLTRILERFLTNTLLPEGKADTHEKPFSLQSFAALVSLVAMRAR